MPRSAATRTSSTSSPDDAPQYACEPWELHVYRMTCSFNGELHAVLLHDWGKPWGPVIESAAAALVELVGADA